MKLITNGGHMDKVITNAQFSKGNEKFKEAKTSRHYSRPDHTHRIERWKENLGIDELRRAVPIVRSAARTFGYELPKEGC